MAITYRRAEPESPRNLAAFRSARVSFCSIVLPTFAMASARTDRSRATRGSAGPCVSQAWLMAIPTRERSSADFGLARSRASM
ncbi:hypothetical protein AB0J35_10890 [Nonomuraea angiospora]|uniref:hypothetical protein n=1 Tax=Nonomuraea angiospora TaxID=46172 RepID=UPI00341F915E